MSLQRCLFFVHRFFSETRCVGIFMHIVFDSMFIRSNGGSSTIPDKIEWDHQIWHTVRLAFVYRLLLWWFYIALYFGIHNSLVILAFIHRSLNMNNPSPSRAGPSGPIWPHTVFRQHRTDRAHRPLAERRQALPTIQTYRTIKWERVRGKKNGRKAANWANIWSFDSLQSKFMQCLLKLR